MPAIVRTMRKKSQGGQCAEANEAKDKVRNLALSGMRNSTSFYPPNARASATTAADFAFIDEGDEGWEGPQFEEDGAAPKRKSAFEEFDPNDNQAFSRTSLRPSRRSQLEGDDGQKIIDTFNLYFDQIDEEMAPTPDFLFYLRFNGCIGAIIAINAIVIAVETDYAEEALDNPVFIVLNNIFFLCLIGEMYLRVRWSSFREYISETANWLDIVCGVISLFNVWILPFIDMVQSGQTTNRGNVFSILRIFRIFRLIRLLKVFSMFRHLNVLINSFAAALGSMVWVSFLIILEIYILGIFCTQMIGKSDRFKDIAIDDMTMNDYFGTLPKAMYTLFEVLTLEGWPTLARALVEEEPLFAVFFIIFIMTSTFGLLNMIVALVVERTLEMASEDPEKKKIALFESRISELKAMREIFLAAGSKNGKLSWSRLWHSLNSNPKVEGAFGELKLQVDSPYALFNFLDKDGDRHLSPEEFIKGFESLKGDTGRTQDMITIHAGAGSVNKNLERLEAQLRSFAYHRKVRQKKLLDVLSQLELSPGDGQKQVRLKSKTHSTRISGVYTNSQEDDLDEEYINYILPPSFIQRQSIGCKQSPNVDWQDPYSVELSSDEEVHKEREFTRASLKM